MPSYIVVSPHTTEDCVKVLKDMLAAGYLTHFDWGCKDGEHTGWAMIEAENKSEALLAVPPSVRKQARVVEISKFDPDAVRAMHF